MKPYIIGITGGSGSGKTLFIKRIIEDFTDNEVCLVSQDNYYKPRNQQPVDLNGVYNFDKPESINIKKFTDDLKKLIEGKTLRIKEYTFNNTEKEPEIFEFQPAPVIILEGIFIFYVEEISRLIDLKIFIDAREHIMLKRRIIRDQRERGYDLEDVLYRYEHHVMPSFNKYILPYKEHSDIIVNNHQNFDEGIKIIRSHISSIFNK
jgi:uridine kinase